MIIREIKKEDNAKVKDIIQDSLKSLGLAIPGSAYYDPQLNDLHQYYNDLKHANYWVIEMEGEVVGGVGIAPFNEHDKVCELQKLYLSPKAQGLGLSKKLMETALSFAANHYEKCYLETMHELKTACTLYGKFGFTLLSEPLPGSEHSAMDAWYLKDLNK
jgi:putative acetyltransferase